MSTSLTIYLWLVFSLTLLSVICLAMKLNSSRYPRETTKSVTLGQDVVSLVACLLLLGWLSYFLFWGGALAK